jgi:lactoylglutathione lyase
MRLGLQAEAAPPPSHAAELVSSTDPPRNVTGVGALVLFTSRVDDVVAFYRAIGLPLEEEAHDDGPVHHACDVAGVHVAVFSAASGDRAPGLGTSGATFAGFAVESVARAVDAARAAGGVVLQEPAEYPWGLRAVLEDPDGRPVEVFEPSAG